MKKQKRFRKLLEIPNLKQIVLGLLISAGITLISNSLIDLINLDSILYWIVAFSIISIFVHLTIIKYEKREMFYGFFLGVGIISLIKIVSLLTIS